MAPTLLLLSTAALLLVSSAAGTPSAAVQDIIEQLSTGCREGVDNSGAMEEIRLGQEEVGEMVAAVQKKLGHDTEEQCPSGWTSHLDSCYLIPLAKSSWFEAQHHCAALDPRARLASLAPSASQFAEELVMSSTSASYGAWIGLTRLEPADAFGWLDGSRLVATRWNRGEPSGDGDCVHIWGPGHGASGWNDLSCAIPNYILCQIKLR